MPVVRCTYQGSEVSDSELDHGAVDAESGERKDEMDLEDEAEMETGTLDEAVDGDQEVSPTQQATGGAEGPATIDDNEIGTWNGGWIQTD